MKTLFLAAVTSAILCQLGFASIDCNTGEDPVWKVRFYESPNGGGKCVSFDVSSNGRAAIPINVFDKYKLENKISEIQFKLPKGTAVCCFTGRFF